MSKRDQLQLEFAKTYMNQTKRQWILDLVMRFGKTFCAVNIFRLYEQQNKEPKILILYPETDIKDSWKTTFEKTNYTNKNITYSTYKSLNKEVKNKYDIIVFDEIQTMSEKNLLETREILTGNPLSYLLGLTGTLSSRTIRELKDVGFEVLCRYTLAQAIEDKIISDYRIKIHFIPLDKNIRDTKNRTEERRYKNITYVIDEKLKNEIVEYKEIIKKGIVDNSLTYEDRQYIQKEILKTDKNIGLLRLKRMSMLQTSPTKTIYTKQILEQLKPNRVLVFCSGNKVGEKLGEVLHTSKKIIIKRHFRDSLTGKDNA